MSCASKIQQCFHPIFFVTVIKKPLKIYLLKRWTAFRSKGLFLDRLEYTVYLIFSNRMSKVKDDSIGYLLSENTFLKSKVEANILRLDFARYALLEWSWRKHQPLKMYTSHSTYSWNIKWQKCARMGLNGFIFKKINENLKIKTKKKNHGSRLEVAC